MTDEGRTGFIMFMAETASDSAAQDAAMKHLPNCTSKWMDNEDMKTHVFRAFKTRRLKVPLESIPWPYHISGMDVDIWLSGQQNSLVKELSVFEDYFNDTLAPIDINPSKWFYDSKGADEGFEHLNSLVEKLMVQVVKAKKEKPLHKGNRFIENMVNAFDSWMATLAHMLKSCPSELNESAYENLFLAFVELFGLKCWQGDHVKMAIPYEVLSTDGQKTVTGIRSEPDLILLRHEYSKGYATAVPLAVVEVKQPQFLPKKHKKMPMGTRKRALSMQRREYEEQQSVEERETESAELCVKRVKFGKVTESASNELEEVAPSTSSVQSPTVSAATSDQTTNTPPCGTSETCEEVLCDELPPSAEIPSKEEKKNWNYFLPQLLGDIVAAGAGYLQHDASKNSSIGIAVTGYSVTFLNFACRRDFQFVEIPLKSDAAMDIFLSEPLCILKKKDREKICKMLLYLALVPLSKLPGG